MSPNIDKGIEIRDLQVKYGSHTVIQNLTAHIPKAKITAIIGPNGSGKSTLVKAILGLIPMAKGSVTLFDEPAKALRGRIGYVPQRFRFDPTFPMTVKEFICLGMRKHKPNADLLEHTLHDVQLENTILSQQIGTLSGGQMQRVLIAQATIHRPQLLILDEPEAGVDIVGEKAFYEILERLKTQHGTTILIVSHDISMVQRRVDEVLCLNNKLVCIGPPKQALTENALKDLFGHDADIIGHHHH